METGINRLTREGSCENEGEEAARVMLSGPAEGDLRRVLAVDIKRLTEIGCYT